MDSNRDIPTQDDLSALAWVQDELRKSLEASNKALHRFLLEAAGAATSDLEDVDPAVLRGARQQLHQSAGALELVGLSGAALLLRAAEAAVQRFVLKPHKLDSAAVQTIEAASFAVMDYLGRLLAGRQVSPVSLFPQYSEVQKLAGAERIHPADLWNHDWRWIELPAEPGMAARPADAAARAEMERLLLAMMRQAAPGPIATSLSGLCAALGAGSTTLETRSFWRLAAAFFEGQALGLLAADLHTKRIASRVLAQLGLFVRGETEVPDRLAQDLLFFCAQCRAPQPGQAHRLTSVRRAYRLEGQVPLNYEVAHLGRFDPALLQQARKRVAQAKESWSAVAGGEMHRLPNLNEQFSLVGDSLKRIYPDGELLGQALMQAVAHTVQLNGHLSAPLAMEVATSVLYLEASLEDGEFDDPALKARTARLAQRIVAVRQGHAPEPLEPWMEELYRRVSDRQTMGSVVQELRASLSDVEEHMDQFFRQPENTSVLVPVPAQLGAMRGVLSVLGMGHASQAVMRMRDELAQIIAGAQAGGAVPQGIDFDRLAGNLSALGFLIDMLSVQPQLAKQLFAFDEASGELRSLVGRTVAPPGALDSAPVAWPGAVAAAPVAAAPVPPAAAPVAPVAPMVAATPPAVPASAVVAPPAAAGTPAARPTPVPPARPAFVPPPVVQPAEQDDDDAEQKGWANTVILDEPQRKPARDAAADAPAAPLADFEFKLVDPTPAAPIAKPAPVAQTPARPLSSAPVPPAPLASHPSAPVSVPRPAASPAASGGWADTMILGEGELQAWLSADAKKAAAPAPAASAPAAMPPAAPGLHRPEAARPVPPAPAAISTPLSPAAAHPSAAPAVAPAAAVLPPLELEPLGMEEVPVLPPSLAVPSVALPPAAAPAVTPAAAPAVAAPALPPLELAPLSMEVPVIPSPAVPPVAARPPAAPVTAPVAPPAVVAPAAPVVPVPAAPVPAVAPPPAAAPAAVAMVVPGTDEEVDPEMREIFLEEAGEVMVQATEGLDQLAAQRTDMEALTVLRRAFHTLKGSSRMVGLKEFGEAGWAGEQLYNTWLAEQRPASEELLTLTREVLDYMRAWIGEINAGTPLTHHSAPVRTAADALRLEGRRVPLAEAAAPASAPELPPSSPPAAQAASAEMASPAVLSEVEVPLLPEAPTTEASQMEPPAAEPEVPAPAFLEGGIDFPQELFELEAAPAAPAAEPVLQETPRLDAEAFESLSFEPLEAFALPQTPSAPAEAPAAARVDERVLPPSEPELPEVPLAFAEALETRATGAGPAAESFEILPEAQAAEVNASDFEALFGDSAPAEPAALPLPQDAVQAFEPLVPDFEVLSEETVAAEPVAPQALQEVVPSELNTSDFDALFGGQAATEELLSQEASLDATSASGFEPRPEDAALVPEVAVESEALQDVQPSEVSASEFGALFGAAAPAEAAVPQEAQAFEAGMPGFELLSEGAVAAESAAPHVPQEATLSALETSDLDALSVDPSATQAQPPQAQFETAVPAMPEPVSLGLPESLVDSVFAEPAPVGEEMLQLLPEASAASVTEFVIEVPPSAALPLEAPVTALDASSDVEGAELASLQPFAADEDTVPGADEALPAADAFPVESLSEGEGASGADDNVRVVGSLQISTPLYNIYLAEADELSRRLCSALREWALEPQQPLPETAVAAAHSLAGSSATVGFSDLSQLARQLEHALLRTQAIGLGQIEEVLLFCEVGDEIRRMLHQFAGGFLKAPHPQLLERLLAHEQESAQRLTEEKDAHGGGEAGNSAFGELLPEARAISAAEFAAGAPVEQAPQPELAEDLSLQIAEALQAVEAAVSRVDEPLPVVEPPPAPAPLPQPAAAPVAFATQPVEKDVAAVPPSSSFATRTDPVRRVQDIDDDIDVVDAVDADLFPIFEEEAEELLPKLAGEMREWLRHPGEAGAANACMRTLHTIKGGARLAGAMRLGELAHRLETSVERLLTRGSIQATDVEPLEAQVDVLISTFEALRQRDAEAHAEAEAALQQALQVSLVPQPAAFDAPQALAEEEGAAESLLPIDWSRFAGRSAVEHHAPRAGAPGAHASVRVRAQLLDRLVSEAGEISITRARLEAEVGNLRSSVGDLTDNLERLRLQLRDIELQAETQMATRMEAAKAEGHQFDPLEFDRFTRSQELARMMAESVNDVATVQRTLQRTLQTVEDELAAQTRLTRELQENLLRTRMVEFEGLSERLYRVVRQAAKESGKQVRLDIVGGSIEVDRGVLDRMTASFEHLLRNGVTHGIETPEQRMAIGKDPVGTIQVALTQEGNEVTVEFRDDGAGLNLARIREKALQAGKISPQARLSEDEIANLIFLPGLTTAETVTELAGRGVGMDVVRADVNAMGGRIETSTVAGRGTRMRLVLPLTTAVTQVVMLRCGETVIGVPASLVEIVRRGTVEELTRAYETGLYAVGEHSLPFYWLGSLLQGSGRSAEPVGRSMPVAIIRSASQRIALHVDEVLGHQEVVVKNLGPQLSRLPGLAGMTLLASGAVSLIYNPVALVAVYGTEARALTVQTLDPAAVQAKAVQQVVETEPAVPLVLVVDDSLTVRRVTQRLLAREGYRVALAKDGLDALERLAEERPTVVLSDIEMPRMDGFDLVRNMRADASLADLPVIMITSRIAQKHRDYAVELGVNHYLGKPYSEEELLGLIAHYCKEAAVSA